jgi:nucleotide-binding universal stress UspA family protein
VAVVHDEQDMLYEETQLVDPEAVRGPRVVVAVDGSAGSRAALRFALDDATRRGVPVEVVVAYRSPDYWTDFNVVGRSETDRMRARLRSEAEARARTAVDEETRAATGPLPEIGVRAVEGAPADALIRASHGADLLVVGSRGHGGFSSVLLGSTSMQCALHATCPVTVVHSPEARRHRLRLHREGKRESEPALG